MSIDGLIPEAKFAALMGVTTRTTYKWERLGILPRAIRINGRKYREAGTRPRFDLPRQPSPEQSAA